MLLRLEVELCDVDVSFEVCYFVGLVYLWLVGVSEGRVWSDYL